MDVEDCAIYLGTISATISMIEYLARITRLPCAGVARILTRNASSTQGPHKVYHAKGNNQYLKYFTVSCPIF